MPALITENPNTELAALRIKLTGQKAKLDRLEALAKSLGDKADEAVSNLAIPNLKASIETLQAEIVKLEKAK